MPLIRKPIKAKPSRLVVEEGKNINPMARQRTKAAPSEQPDELLVFKPVKPQRVGRNARPAEGIAAESPAAFQQEAQEIASEYGDQFDDLTGWQKDAYQMYIDGNDDAESCII
jgi:hypothetical protein